MDGECKRIEDALAEILAGEDVCPDALAAAMRHAVLGGGKRLRPRMCLAAARAAGGGRDDAILAACAVELLHSYTLVHDDLPAMDGDRTRRGRPSVWAAFGEAEAILAGDALQALAFETAARSPRNAGSVVAELAKAAFGVVCGQSAESSAKTEDDLEFVMVHKTGDLFVCAAAMGAYAAGADEKTVAAMRRYAAAFGTAYQFRDDLIDGGDGSFSSLGFFSRDEIEDRMRNLAETARCALDGLPGDVSGLEDILGVFATADVARRTDR